ncbi:carbohydrate ABC transporter permease [Metabacillus endolithicus]|uniref:Carbohydrate ABC transporter permease n=1 Tax=Metabacillus endolithicus TaxID=1535204 RepID=A0ABW5C1J9_9BACI|nr:sugar ABC transporter permease [Metabacillus endolithicus]UPG65496.1 sugar ABC transporter permease [Metabacillus endolithicus]
MEGKLPTSPLKNTHRKISKTSLEKKEARDAWIMMSPAIIILLLIAVYPIIRTFWISLHEMVLTDPSSGYPFIGLENYVKIFNDQRAMDSIIFTLKFTVVTVFFELLLGFGAALLMNKAFIGRGFVRASILVPWAIPTTVSALMWKFIYNDQYGLFNDILTRFHVIDSYQAWLSSSSGSFMALVITDVWKTAPFIALLTLAGLQMIPKELYESAKIDGANKFQIFLNITLPLVKYTVIVALLFRTLDAFRVFELITVMTGGANRTESLSVYAYNNLMKFLDFGYGSAMSMLIFGVVFLISLIYMKALGSKLTDF